MSSDRRARGLVMLCDVDLGFPDATRTHTVEVAKGFAREGLEVDLVARGAHPPIPGVRYIQARGGEHERLRRLLALNARTVAALWRRRRSAWRFYVRDKWTCFPSIVFARLLGYAVVLQVDGVPYGGNPVEGQGRLVQWGNRAIAIATGHLAAGALAVTAEIKTLLVALARMAPQRIAVIPNGVDLDLFTPVPREEAIARCGLDPACRYVTFCGGFHPWTDFDAILAAFARVAAAQPEARLLLVGDGPERPRIERLSEELGLRDRVTITGMVHERQRVRDLLGATTVALLVYRRDQVNRTSASPIKLTEYLACARATVAVDIPGVRELLEHHGAGLVVSGEPDGLAQAVLDLLDPVKADAMGRAGRRYAEENLSWQSVVQRTLPLFAQ